MFHSFLSDNSKKYVATTAAHSKRIIEILKNKCLGVGISTIWENKNGCSEKYICVTALYLLPIWFKSYNIIIEFVPGHGR